MAGANCCASYHTDSCLVSCLRDRDVNGRSGNVKRTWLEEMKSLTSKLESVGPSWLLRWGPKDYEHVRLDTLFYMAK